MYFYLTIISQTFEPEKREPTAVKLSEVMLRAHLQKEKRALPAGGRSARSIATAGAVGLIVKHI